MPAKAGIQILAKARGPRFRGDERNAYSIRSLASCTTLPHFSISSLMRLPNSSGVLAIGTGLLFLAQMKTFRSRLREAYATRGIIAASEDTRMGNP